MERDRPDSATTHSAYTARAEGDAKREEWERAAAKRDAAWQQQQAQGTARRGKEIQWGLVATGMFVAIAIGIGAYVVTSGEASRPTPTVAATPPDSPVTRVANAESFAQAIALARPALTNTTEELGEGAKLLASYASHKLRWSEVDVPAETTLGRVEKDPALERGKRLCTTGEIQRIARRDLGGRRLYVGQLRTAENDDVAFVAVGTTGDLVKRSTGTLCGAVLGMSGRSVSILGMFDLDENRMPLVEQ